jgi:hypothetical protein
MNRCFNEKDNFYSNIRRNAPSASLEIVEQSRAKKESDGFLGSVLRILALLRTRVSARVLTRIKACVVVTSLLLFVGIIGAMERGTLPFGAGMLLGALVLIAEILCLRPSCKTAANEDEQ